MREKFTKLGAELAKPVTVDTTYLISTQTSVDRQLGNVKEALKYGIPIVSLGWLEECARLSSHLDYEAFLLTSASSPAPASAPTTAAPTKKSKGKRRIACAPPQTTKLAVPIQSLLQLIFNQTYMAAAMTSLKYDAKKMPLGKLSKENINHAFKFLGDLAALHQSDAHSGRDIKELSSRYYSLIPHDFGQYLPPIIADPNRIKAELNLVESLGYMKEAVSLMKNGLSDTKAIHPLDRQYRSLDLQEMTVLKPDTWEFQELKSYLMCTREETRDMVFHLENIFRIERNDEAERFRKGYSSKIKSHRRLLWHGSRATSFGGILSQGLRAPASGYRFGKGIYLADMSSKSVNYCYYTNSGKHVLLLLCEVELGNPMFEPPSPDYNARDNAIQDGNWSTWGKGIMEPPVWKDAKCVHSSLKGVKMVGIINMHFLIEMLTIF